MDESEFLKKVGKNIVAFRKKKGLRQIDLAYKLGMEDSSLRRIENGRTNTTLKMIYRISRCLNINACDLIK